MQVFKKKQNRGLGASIFIWIIGIFLTIYAISLLVPLFWALINSLKSYGQFRKDPLFFPTDVWHWENYKLAFFYFHVIIPYDGGQKVVYLAEMFFNSFMYSGLGAVISAFVPMFAAYLAVIYKNWLSKLATTIVIVTMVLPIYGGGGAYIVLLQKLNLYDNFFAQ